MGLLLFTTESVVLAYYDYISRELYLGKTDRVARLLVAMLVVCSRLENELTKSGLRKILDWTMAAISPREQFYTEFWQEVEVRLEMGDLEEGMLIQLGCYITAKAYDKSFITPQLLEE